MRRWLAVLSACVYVEMLTQQRTEEGTVESEHRLEGNDHRLSGLILFEASVFIMDLQEHSLVGRRP